jgi:hypothetical protein
MARTAEKSDPKLWEKVKRQVTAGEKGGRKGQWSARKAQLAVQEYKRQGGGYKGRRAKDNALSRWTEEEWGTRSGRKSTETGERYLPKKARSALSETEYARTTAKKRADTRKGRQFSDQPKDIAKKSARYRRGKSGPSRAELYAEAKRKGIPGRSRMSKAELERALDRGS